MRVMQIVPMIDYGGAEQMVLNLTRGLEMRGVDTLLVCLYSHSGNAIDMLRRAGIGDGSVVTMDKRLGFDPFAVARLRQMICAYCPDVIHTHQYALRYLLAASLRLPWRPCFHTLHTPEEAQRKLATNLEHHFARVCGVVAVGVAPAVAESYRRNGRYGFVEVVPNGIDVSRFRPDDTLRDEWRRANDIDDDAIVFVCVARLHQLKNHELLVMAFQSMASNCSGAMLLFVGEGPLRETLGNLVEALDLSKRILFLGASSGVESVLRGSDVFVLASKWEGNSLALLEAMATGLPVIASRVGGIPDVVRDEDTALLFASGDQEALAVALERLYTADGVRKEMGARARIDAELSYSVESMVESYLRLYLKGLGRATPQLR